MLKEKNMSGRRLPTHNANLQLDQLLFYGVGEDEQEGQEGEEKGEDGGGEGGEDRLEGGVKEGETTETEEGYVSLESSYNIMTYGSISTSSKTASVNQFPGKGRRPLPSSYSDYNFNDEDDDDNEERHVHRGNDDDDNADDYAEHQGEDYPGNHGDDYPGNYGEEHYEDEVFEGGITNRMEERTSEADDGPGFDREAKAEEENVGGGSEEEEEEEGASAAAGAAVNGPRPTSDIAYVRMISRRASRRQMTNNSLDERDEIIDELQQRVTTVDSTLQKRNHEVEEMSKVLAVRYSKDDWEMLIGDINDKLQILHLTEKERIQQQTASSVAPSASISAAAYMTPDLGIASYRESNALLLEARLEYLDAKFNRVQSEIAELQALLRSSRTEEEICWRLIGFQAASNLDKDTDIIKVPDINQLNTMIQMTLEEIKEDKAAYRDRVQLLVARLETLSAQRQIVHEAVRNLGLRGDLDRAGYTRMKAEVVRRSVSMKDMMKHRPSGGDAAALAGDLRVRLSRTSSSKSLVSCASALASTSPLPKRPGTSRCESRSPRFPQINRQSSRYHLNKNNSNSNILESDTRRNSMTSGGFVGDSRRRSSLPPMLTYSLPSANKGSSSNHQESTSFPSFSAPQSASTVKSNHHQQQQQHQLQQQQSGGSFNGLPPIDIGAGAGVSGVSGNAVTGNSSTGGGAHGFGRNAAKYSVFSALEWSSANLVVAGGTTTTTAAANPPMTIRLSSGRLVAPPPPHPANHSSSGSAISGKSPSITRKGRRIGRSFSENILSKFAKRKMGK